MRGRGDAPVARSFDRAAAVRLLICPGAVYQPDVCSEQRGRRIYIYFSFHLRVGFFLFLRKKEHLERERDRGTICMKGEGGNARYYLDRDGGTELF